MLKNLILGITSILKQKFFCFSIFEKDKHKYERSLDDIFAILDTDKSGTIHLEELEKLYPDAAHSLLERFDLDHDGELDAKEFADFVDSLKVANDILKRLQAQVNSFLNFCLSFY